MVHHLPTQEIPCCSGIWSFLLDYILNLPHPIPHLHAACLRTIVILHVDLLSVFFCNFCLNSLIHLSFPLIMQHALPISLPHSSVKIHSFKFHQNLSKWSQVIYSMWIRRQKDGQTKVTDTFCSCIVNTPKMLINY